MQNAFKTRKLCETLSIFHPNSECLRTVAHTPLMDFLRKSGISAFIYLKPRSHKQKIQQWCHMHRKPSSGMSASLRRNTPRLSYDCAHMRTLTSLEFLRAYTRNLRNIRRKSGCGVPCAENSLVRESHAQKIH